MFAAPTPGSRARWLLSSPCRHRPVAGIACPETRRSVPASSAAAGESNAQQGPSQPFAFPSLPPIDLNALPRGPALALPGPLDWAPLQIAAPATPAGQQHACWHARSHHLQHSLYCHSTALLLHITLAACDMRSLQLHHTMQPPQHPQSKPTTYPTGPVCHTSTTTT